MKTKEKYIKEIKAQLKKMGGHYVPGNEPIEFPILPTYTWDKWLEEMSLEDLRKKSKKGREIIASYGEE
jgi:hypothetical protein